MLSLLRNSACFNGCREKLLRFTPRRAFARLEFLETLRIIWGLAVVMIKRKVRPLFVSSNLFSISIHENSLKWLTWLKCINTWGQYMWKTYLNASLSDQVTLRWEIEMIHRWEMQSSTFHFSLSPKLCFPASLLNSPSQYHCFRLRFPFSFSVFPHPKWLVDPVGNWPDTQFLPPSRPPFTLLPIHSHLSPKSIYSPQGTQLCYNSQKCNSLIIP